jgi:hypothetical protein
LGLRGIGCNPLPGRMLRPRPRRMPKPRVEPPVVTPGPIGGAALRQRLRRARQKNGEVVLQIAVNEIALTEVLSAANLLPPSTDHDRPQIQAAVERLLALMIADGHA